MNKNNQTTSTKCQYQALKSKQMKWLVEFWIEMILLAVVARKIDPIRTWIPWKPVAKKNVDPYTESENVKLASKYSIPWHNVNRTPRIIVIIKAKRLFLMSFDRNEWWDQVIVAPDDRRIIEFNNGISIGLKIFTPAGGQVLPSSIFGEILLWK